MFFAFCVVGCNQDLITSAEKLKADSHQSLDMKNFSDAATISQKLINKEPDNYEGYFMLAQAKSQIGDKTAAVVSLEQAIKFGLKDKNKIENNKNLDPIKSMIAYKELISSNFPIKENDNSFQSIVSASAVTSRSTESTNISSDSTSSVSIQEVNGKQVVRAGNVTVEVQNSK